MVFLFLSSFDSSVSDVFSSVKSVGSRILFTDAFEFLIKLVIEFSFIVSPVSIFIVWIPLGSELDVATFVVRIVFNTFAAALSLPVFVKNESFDSSLWVPSGGGGGIEPSLEEVPTDIPFPSLFDGGSLLLSDDVFGLYMVLSDDVCGLYAVLSESYCCLETKLVGMYAGECGA